MSHTIRLHGPWTYYLGPVSAENARRFQVPGLLEGASFDGVEVVTLRRTFHRPTGLEPANRLYLEGIGAFGKAAQFELNGRDLGEVFAEKFRHEITKQLNSSNQLTLICKPDINEPIRIDSFTLVIE